MLFATPEVSDRELGVIAQVDELRSKLRRQLHEPRRWIGSLRRVSTARAIQGSNSIEGYDAALDDVAAVGLGEEPLSADDETGLALKGYRDALTYVLQLANEPDFEYSVQLIKSLHFMMTSYDLKTRPGLWRAGGIFVRNDATGQIVYEGADVDDVPELMSELADSLNAESDAPATVPAGMAHLNLVMVHPFRDANGRMARCLQTLVLAREGILAPAFCSIEEYLGRNTQDYYAVLTEVGGGSWQPERDALSWVRFTLTAHLRQARTLLRRVKESERLWDELERLAVEHGLPDRVIPLLFDAAIGFRVRNATYRAMWDDDISEQVASRDLRSMVNAGVLTPHGESRGRYYTATPTLRAKHQAIIANRDPRDDTDPFEP